MSTARPGPGKIAQTRGLDTGAMARLKVTAAGSTGTMIPNQNTGSPATSLITRQRAGGATTRLPHMTGSRIANLDGTETANGAGSTTRSTGSTVGLILERNNIGSGQKTKKPRVCVMKTIGVATNGAGILAPE